MHTECVLIAAYFGLLFSDAMRIKLNQFHVISRTRGGASRVAEIY